MAIDTRPVVPSNVRIAPGHAEHFDTLWSWSAERPIDERKTLQDCLDAISRIDRNCGGRGADLFPDFAPHSFGWAAGGMVGGCIYFAPEDDGTGGAPQYTVTLTKRTGWSLHS